MTMIMTTTGITLQLSPMRADPPMSLANSSSNTGNKKSSLDGNIGSWRLSYEQIPFDTPKLAVQHAIEFHNCGAVCVPADKLTSQPTNGGTEVIGRRTSTTFLNLEKMLDIWQVPRKHNIALKCGVGSGLFVLNVNNRGDFVPNLKPGKYGVAHTAIGNAIRQTQRIIDGSGNTSAIFGIYPEEWPEGLYSCTLLRQTDLFGLGTISLLADSAYALIEPSIHAHTGQSYRFYTPFKHELGAGSATKSFPAVYLLGQVGITTMHRSEISELARSIDPDWHNGPIYANNKNRIPNWGGAI
jgi:hypothetical protein